MHGPSLLQQDNRLGGRIGLFVMAEDEGIDIDTELDVALAARLLTARTSR